MLYAVYTIGVSKMYYYEEMKEKKYGFHFFSASHSTEVKINYKTERVKKNNIREIMERVLEKELAFGKSQGLVLGILILLATYSLPAKVSVNKLR